MQCSSDKHVSCKSFARVITDTKVRMLVSKTSDSQFLLHTHVFMRTCEAVHEYIDHRCATMAGFI